MSDGGIKLVIYIPPNADPEIVRDNLCKEIGARVENLMRADIIPGKHEWEAIERRWPPDHLLSQDQVSKFPEVYRKFHTNGPGLRAELQDDQTYNFMHKLNEISGRDISHEYAN